MFLRIEDYSNIITQDNLSVIQGEDAFRRDAELSAQEEISSYLRFRYSVELIFKDIKKFSISDIYYKDDLIEYSETAYSESNEYLTGERVSYAGNIYKSIAGNTSEAFDSSKWTLVSENKLLYYAKQQVTGQYPDEYIATYTSQNYITNLNNITGWDGANVHLYFKKTSTELVTIYATELDRTNNTNPLATFNYDAEGLDVPQNVPIIATNTLSGWLTIKNFIPDDQEFDIELTQSWVLGDNRNAKIKNITLDVALYELHKRINPRQIPELRVTAKDEAITWLNRVSKSNTNIFVDLPLRAIEQTDIEIESGNDEQIY